MVYYPSNIKIPDKVCIIGKPYHQTPNKFVIGFSDKITEPPNNTIAIVENNFSGPFIISKIQPSTGSFYANLNIKNIINSKNGITLIAVIQHWSLNDIFHSCVVQKDWTIGKDINFVAVTYGQHSSMILKGYEIYNTIKGIK